MGSGFESYLPNNKMQFSSENSSYYYYTKGIVYTQTAPSFANTAGSIAYVPRSRDNLEITAVRSTASLARAGLILPVDDSMIDPYLCSGSPGTAIEYFIFRPVFVTGPSAYGFDTYASNGALTFSMLKRPMMVHGYLNGPEQTAYLPGDRAYAFVIGQFGGYSYITFDQSIQQQLNDKGQVIYYYYNAHEDYIDYGVLPLQYWNIFKTSNVPYAARNFQYIVNQNDPPPPDRYEYNVNIDNVLFVDVTNL